MVLEFFDWNVPEINEESVTSKVLNLFYISNTRNCIKFKIQKDKIFQSILHEISKKEKPQLLEE